MRPLRILTLIGLCTLALPSGAGTIAMRGGTASALINAALTDSYWIGSWQKDYTKDLWDEIRLKEDPNGFVPMITGEGERDYDHDLVVDLVFNKMGLLPYYMKGAIAVENLGRGHDMVVNTDYVDTFYIIDLTLFYCAFTQRMYLTDDTANGRTILSFEKITESMVGAGTWAAYQQRTAQIVEDADMRKALFSKVIEPSEVHGMFIVSPGTEHKSRVTLVSRLTFGEDAGWIATLGSQMPGVLKAGVKSGFRACVAIADVEQAKRDKQQAG